MGECVFLGCGKPATNSLKIGDWKVKTYCKWHAEEVKRELDRQEGKKEEKEGHHAQSGV